MNSIQFNFTKNYEYIYKIESDIILHIERVSNSMCNLFFTDENENIINIPDTIEVNSFNHENKIICLPIDHKFYFLYWNNDYEISYANIIMLYIKSQKSWDIDYLIYDNNYSYLDNK
jgi:hypothetical protein